MTTADTAQDNLLPWRDPEFRLAPWPWYQRLRRDHPVYKMADGTYIVSRYSDVSEFAKLPSMSILEPGGVVTGPWAALKNTVLSMDPPEHTAMRRHSNRWFTPKLVKRWVEVTEAVTNEAIDRLGADGEIEAHRELAVIPTHVTMCRVFQLPEDNVDPVIDAMNDVMVALIAEPQPGDWDRADASFQYLLDRCAGMLADKRRNPGDGLADEMLAAVDRGEMTERQVLETVTLFWGSGAPNPGYLIAAGIEEFARNPQVFGTYRSDPSTRKAIVNELIRMNNPEISIVRFPTEDVEIRGVQIPAGSRIRFMLASANRDPEVFEHPEEFDHIRPPEASRNLAFGLGPHSCAGQVISRAETETVLTAIAERIDRIELIEEPTVAHTDRARAYLKMPVRLSPAR